MVRVVVTHEPRDLVRHAGNGHRPQDRGARGDRGSEARADGVGHARRVGPAHPASSPVTLGDGVGGLCAPSQVLP